MSPILIYSFMPMDRSARVRWLLEEIGLSYKDIFLDYGTKQQRSPEYLKVNPFGRVPAVVIDNKTITESLAIVTYLADLHVKKGLAPELHSAHRADYLQWMAFGNSTLEGPLVKVFSMMNLTGDEKEAKRKEMKEGFALLAEPLNAFLSEKETLLPVGFSACDIMVAHTLGMAYMSGILSAYPELDRYYDRMTSREAAVRAKVKPEMKV